MKQHNQYPTATDGRSSLTSAPEAGDRYPFSAPTHGLLVVCPYCDGEARCDFCGDEGHIFADDFFGGTQ